MIQAKQQHPISTTKNLPVIITSNDVMSEKYTEICNSTNAASKKNSAAGTLRRLF